MEKISSNSKRQSFSRLIKFTAVISLIFIVLVSPEMLWAQKAIGISIGTAQIGGVWYPLGGTMANVISKYLPGVGATAEVTNGAVDNAKLLAAGKIELAIISSHVGYDAYMGKGVFKEKIPLRILAPLNRDVTYIVCLEGKGINSVRDLEGKRVSTGVPGSSGEIMTLKILEAYGIDPNKDIRRERLSASEASGSLKDGKIDAFFWTGGIPGAAILDLAATPGIRIKLIDHGEIVPKVAEKYGPLYIKAVLPAKTYRGIDYDVSTLGQSNLLVCHTKMDENLAYNIVKVLLEHKDELVAGHKAAAEIKLENAELVSPFPYHPGAIKYYKEKGLKISL